MDDEEEDGETITLFGGAKLKKVEQEGQSCEKAATTNCGHVLSQLPHLTTRESEILVEDRQSLVWEESSLYYNT